MTAKTSQKRSPLNFIRAIAIICLLGAGALMDRTHAATVTWDPSLTGTGSDGSGTWSTGTADWAANPGDAVWTNSNDAVFGVGGTAGTITVSGGVSVDSITFNPVASGTYYTITASTITMTGSDLITTNAASATINSVLEGSTGLNISGTGALTLGGANTYSGGTTIGGGTLIVTNTSALGTGSVVDNGTLLYSGLSAIGVNNAISGSGAVTGTATNGVTLLGSITMTGTGGFNFNGGSGSSSIGSNGGSITLSVANGTGTVTTGTVSGATGMFLGSSTASSSRTVTLAASGTGSISIRAINNNSSGDSPSLSLSGLNLSTSGNVNLYGNNLNTGESVEFNHYWGSTTSITASSGTATITGDGGSGKSSAEPFYIEGGITTNLSAAFGAAIVLQTGTLCSSSATLFQDANGGSDIFNVTGPGAVLISATSGGSGDTFWSGATVFKVSGGGSLTFNAGVTKVNDTFTVSDTNNSMVNFMTSEAGSGTSTGAMTINSGTLAYTVSGAGTLTQSGVISGAGSVVMSGTGTLILSASNSYSGGTVISGGVLDINSDPALGGTTSGITFAGGGTLQSGSNNISLSSARGITISPSVTGTIDTQGNGFTINGVIGGASGGLTKVGSGTLTLPNNDTYGGATTINNGTLNVTGTLGNSAVAVNNGGTLQATGLVGNTVAVNSGGILIGAGTVNGLVTVASSGTLNNMTGTLAGGLTVNGGGTVNLGGAVETLMLGNTLTIGSGASAATLDFAGNGSNYSLISDPGSALNLTGTASINIMGLGGLNPGDYNLITFSSVSNPGDFTLATPFVGGKNLSLLDTGTSEQLVVAGAAAYWTGSNGVVWNTTNWAANPAETSGTTAPTSTVSVYFSGNQVAGPVTSSLGANFDIGLLGFISAGATTISDGTYGLQIESGGIAVGAGAGAATISATGVAVAGSQLWSNNSNSLLTVTSPVMGTAATSSTTTLAVTGTGTGGVTLNGPVTDGTGGGQLALQMNAAGEALTLTGDNSYSGGTSITSGTVQVGNGGTLGSGGVLDNGALIFSGSGLTTVPGVISGSGAFAESGSGTVILTASNTFSGTTTISSGTLQLGDGVSHNGYLNGNITDNSVLAFSNPSLQTYSASISGAGALVVNGPSALILTGSNSYGGTTTITGGALVVGNGGSTGSPGAGAIVDNSVLIFDETAITLSNPISGTGTVSGTSTNGSTISNSITMSGNGGFNFSCGSGGTSYIGNNVTLSVANGTGTITTGTVNGSGLFFGTGAPSTINNVTLNAGTGSISISAISSASSGATPALSLGGLSLTTSGNVNLSGSATSIKNGVMMDSFYGSTSIAALSGTAAITGYAGAAGFSGWPVLFNNNPTVTLSASFGASIALQGSAPAISGYTIFEDLDGASTINLNGAGAVSFSAAAAPGSDAFWSNNGTQFNVSGGGSLTLNTGVTGLNTGLKINLTNSSMATISTADASAGTFSGAMTLTSGTLAYNVTGAGIITQSGAVTGAGTLLKTGTGTLNLPGSNYTAPISVLAGLLTLSGTSSSNATANGGTIIVSGGINGNATVNDGGTLGGGGTITDNVTVGSGTNPASSAVIQPSANGGAPGTVMTIGESLTLNSDAVYQFSLVSSNTNGVADILNVGEALDINTGAMLAGIDVGNGVLPLGTQYVIAYAGGGFGGTGDTFANAPQGGLIQVGQNFFTVDYGNINTDEITLTAAIPEPETWATIIGGFALLCMYQRRLGRRAGGK